jgi:hypothetical protein
MARLYADENFKKAVVLLLRSLGHDVLRAQEAGQANRGIPDPDVLAFATSLGRAVLTFNRWDYILLHSQVSNHCGIIACTDDDAQALAARIDQAIAGVPTLDNQLLRIDRPSVP